MSSKTGARPLTPSVWRTASLRYAVAFSSLFGLGAAVMVAGVDYGLMRFAEAEARDGLTHQMMVMRADANLNGTAQLVSELNADAKNRDARRYLLLVEAPDGSSFSSGLTRRAITENGFRRNLPNPDRPARWPDQTPNMLTLSARADDGGLLAVGRDIQHLVELRGLIRNYALILGVILILLALAGGWLAGKLFLRRLDAVNTAVGRLIAGQDSARLPAVGLGREFDTLSTNLNLMLDRQEAALTTLKTLSEGVAHELRAPLNRVRNRLEDVAQHHDDPEQRQIAIERALEETDQVSSLFEALLTLARMEGGSTALQLQPLDLAELVQTVADIYGPFVEEAEGQIHSQIEPTGQIMGDPALLQQALANLIENGVFHGGGQIHLSTCRQAGTAEIRIADRGQGVPEAEREKVLRRFYRGQQALAGQKSGTGLGLAMVAAVTRAHGGEIQLEDHQPGLCVTLRLPLMA